MKFIKSFLKQFFTYFSGSIIYFFVLLALFFVDPGGDSATRSQIFVASYFFMSYVLIPQGLGIGAVSAIIVILFRKKTSFFANLLVLLGNISLPFLTALVFVILTQAKAQFYDNPSCVRTVTQLIPLTTITNVQTKTFGKTKERLDTIEVTFDINYTGEKAINSLGYVKLLAPAENDVFTYQEPRFSNEPHSADFPRIMLKKGRTHISRYVKIREPISVDTASQLSEQLLDISLNYENERPWGCACTSCSQDVLIFAKYREKTHIDLTKFAQDSSLN